MRILDRYILKSVTNLFFGCLALFLFLYIIVDVFSHLDEILKQQASWQLLLQYYISFLPSIFVQVAPIACLLSTLYTFAKLNHNNEVIAMRSAGLSIFQITKGVIIFGLLTSSIVFLVSDKIVPYSSVQTEYIKGQFENIKNGDRKNKEAIINLSMYGLKNRLFFINRFYPNTSKMEGITVLEHNETQDITRKIVANNGEYRNKVWIFQQSITYNFDQEGRVIGEPIYYEEEIMAIPETPRDFLTQRQRPEFMNIAQLEEYIWKLSRSGATDAVRNLLVDFYQRFTSPLTSLAIIFLAIPFALMIRKRSAGLSSIGLSIMVGFLYYVFNSVSIALGKAGLLMPVLAASLSLILALTISLYLISILP